MSPGHFFFCSLQSEILAARQIKNSFLKLHQSSLSCSDLASKLPAIKCKSLCPAPPMASSDTPKPSHFFFCSLQSELLAARQIKNSFLKLRQSSLSCSDLASKLQAIKCKSLCPAQPMASSDTSKPALPRPQLVLQLGSTTWRQYQKF